MVIVGISSGYHDSTAAVVIDGEVKASVAEERLSLQKHDSGFPTLALDACLKQLNLRKDQIDHVAFFEEPSVKFTRVLAAEFARFPRSWRSFAGSMREIARSSLLVKYEIFRETGVHPAKIHCVPHHLSHAACAFIPSGFSDAAILVMDAVGEWSCTSTFHGKTGPFSLEPIDTVSYPHSLGLFYSAFTAYLGFPVNDGECNLMALASFGSPRHLDKVEKVLKLHGDGSYELDPSYFEFSDKSRPPLSDKFYRLFGAPRNHGTKLPFSLYASVHAKDEEQYYADLAASVQHLLEEAAIGLCRGVKKSTGAKNLCLSGGIALNSVLNGRLMREAGFKNVFVPPDTGDGGGAMGAALYLAGTLGENTKHMLSPYQGISYEDSWTESVADRKFSRKRMNENDLISSVCDDLRAGKVVGWFQGRFELGPRALGNRSLLIDPASRTAAEKLSRIKSRAPFRPYACSVTAEHAAKLFAGDTAQPAMEWMSSVHPVKEEAKNSVKEALHINGTTRPQVLRSEVNPRYHRLLRAWGERSGLEALLNTSMNASGYPMAANPLDALVLFARSEIDTMVVDDSVFRKDIQ